VEFAQQSFHRFVHILAFASPPLDPDSSSFYRWRVIANAVAEFCLSDFSTRSFSEADGQTIRLLLKLRNSPDLSDSHWKSWSSIAQLLGHFDHERPLSDSEISIIIKAVQVTSFRKDSQSVQLLHELSTTLLNPEIPASVHIIQYAVESLAIYIWAHQYSDFHGHIIDALAGILTFLESKVDGVLLSDRGLGFLLLGLYSIVFDVQGNLDKYWGSGHPFVFSADLGHKLPSVQVLHFAITDHIAARAARATSKEDARKHLRRLCRLLAYTPGIPVHDDASIRIAEGVLAQLPPGIRIGPGVDCSDMDTFAAVAFSIWIRKMSAIPRIHEYLALFLSSRKKFPKLVPMWCDCYKGALDINQKADQVEKDWLSALKGDRMITELLIAFDELILAGCSAKQHLVVVLLAIDNLSEDTGSIYDGYYTKRRKEQILGLHSPALLLLGSRAAGIPYSGAPPSSHDPLWNNLGWIEAMEFWCRRYEELGSSADEQLVYAALVGNKKKLASFIVDSSATNQPLQASSPSHTGI